VLRCWIITADLKSTGIPNKKGSYGFYEIDHERIFRNQRTDVELLEKQPDIFPAAGFKPNANRIHQ